MLELLKLKNVYHQEVREVRIEPRQLNFLTGGNGLGKSRLLDIAWWALTQDWAGNLVLPAKSSAKAKIAYRYAVTDSTSYEFTSSFDQRRKRWSEEKSCPTTPDLVLYVQADGGFSTWDPARTDKLIIPGHISIPSHPAACHFTPQEVWKGNAHCAGLIRDWNLWRWGTTHGTFEALNRVLEVLSPSPEKPLKVPYYKDTPSIPTSSAIRRILALGYLLTWLWKEHLTAAASQKRTPAQKIILLIDEIEAHLHPQWQRRIVSALMKVARVLTDKHEVQTQLIATTHSPLILASTEPFFDSDNVALYGLEESEEHKVVLSKYVPIRHGDISNWLTSEAFGLLEARSLEAEAAVREALSLVKQSKPSANDIRQVNERLCASLSDIDRFWVRWSAFRDAHLSRTTP
jgi:predicted ATPase